MVMAAVPPVQLSLDSPAQAQLPVFVRLHMEMDLKAQLKDVMTVMLILAMGVTKLEQ